MGPYLSAPAFLRATWSRRKYYPFVIYAADLSPCSLPFCSPPASHAQPRLWDDVPRHHRRRLPAPARTLSAAMTPPAAPAFVSAGALRVSAFSPSPHARQLHPRALRLHAPPVRMCDPPSPPPSLQMPLPPPPLPVTPMDPTLGEETGVVTVGAAPTATESWVDGVLAARAPLSASHPLAALRAQADADLPEVPPPSRRDESWRFTDLRSVYASHYLPAAPPDRDALERLDVRRYAPDTAGVVLVFVDGVFDERLSLLSDDSADEWRAAGGYFGSVGGYAGDVGRVRELLTRGELGKGGEGGGFFPTVAHAIATDALVLDVPDGFHVARPVAVLFVSTSGESPERARVSATRTVVVAGRSSKLTLLESHVSLDEEDSYSLAISASAMAVGDNAFVTHYLVNDCCLEAQLVSSVHARVERDATYELRSIGLGSKVGRLTAGIDLEGDGSHGLVHGALVADGYQVMDIHSRLCHNARNTTSDQLQKNIATDHGRAIFNGKIIVTEQGITTDSSQLCRSLLLSDKATIDAMPVLEISTDDVQCSHGATVSDLEDDELFYCQSRGLTHKQAQYLIMAGFALDVLGDCPFPSIRTQIADKIDVVSRKSLKRERDNVGRSSI